MMNYYFSSLIFINGEYLANGAKKHLLFVEGSSDEDFLVDFFNNDICIKNIKYNIFIDKGRIWSIADIRKICEISEPYNKNKKDNERENKEVIKFINAYVQNRNDVRLNCIDCYGFIDRDFDQETDRLGRIRGNISYTEMHDRETTIIRYCLPYYLDYIDSNKKSGAIIDIKNAIQISLRQGLCEGLYWRKRQFRDWSIPKEEKDKEHNLYNLVRKKYDEMDAIFNSSYVIKYNDIAPINNLIPYDIDKYEKIENLVNSCRTEIENFYKNNSYDTINSIIDKWIKKEETLTVQENALLDNIFKLSNGHFLISHMLSSNFNFYNIYSQPLKMNKKNKDNEKSFMNSFVRKDLNDRNEPIVKRAFDQLYSKRPFRNYLNYRINLHS